MFEFLAPTTDPIILGFESHEVAFGKNQPQYTPLPALRTATGIVLTRWKLTDEQREALELGADVFVEVATANKPLQPMRLAIGTEIPEETAAKYRPQTMKAQS